MSEFRVGEIAIACNLIIHTHLNGEECQIIGGLEERWVKKKNGLPCEAFKANRYKVRWSDGKITATSPKNLRKKKPPLGDWEDIEAETNWNPVKETTFINE